MDNTASISYLPKHKQTDLGLIIGIIKGTIPEVGMALLYGSYARGDYVDFDKRVDFGESKTYQSDYDILVLTHKTNKNDIEKKQQSVIDKYYAAKNKQKQEAERSGKTIHITPLRLLHKDIEGFNNEISDNNYFSVQIKNEGIVLLDKEVYRLSDPRALNYKEIQVLAQEYYDFRMGTVENHLIASELLFSKQIYNLSAYHLQQALENIYHSILLVFSLYSPKNHKLQELNKAVYQYAPSVSDCFGSPNDDDDTKLIFSLIDKAYIEGRFDRKYSTTKEQIELAITKIKDVLRLAKESNQEQINKYGELFDKQNQSEFQNK